MNIAPTHTLPYIGPHCLPDSKSSGGQRRHPTGPMCERACKHVYKGRAKFTASLKPELPLTALLWQSTHHISTRTHTHTHAHTHPQAQEEPTCTCHMPMNAQNRSWCGWRRIQCWLQSNVFHSLVLQANTLSKSTLTAVFLCARACLWVLAWPSLSSPTRPRAQLGVVCCRSLQLLGLHTRWVWIPCGHYFLCCVKFPQGRIHFSIKLKWIPCVLFYVIVFFIFFSITAFV